ncbi:putative HAT dimerization domain, ribonuclease H-like superfamily [Helianthus annuus]|nr:putative HAT dimerization domain, ribonuclease H-like superfamily [Helianthus annuus]
MWINIYGCGTAIQILLQWLGRCAGNTTSIGGSLTNLTTSCILLLFWILPFVEHCFTKMITSEITENDHVTKEDVKKMVSLKLFDLKSRLHELFQTYMEKIDTVDYNSASQEARNDDVVGSDEGNDFFTEFLCKEESKSVGIDSELKRYLDEPRMNFDIRFDILKWWKQNAIRFLVVSRMARDILAIQISTVAFESAFSTSGRVLDAYRTRLSTNIVEALICTQDWVRKSRKPILDDVDDILKDDDIALDAIQQQNGKGKGMVHDKA